MDVLKYVDEYVKLLDNLSKTKYFSQCSINQFLSQSILNNTGIKNFYIKNALTYKKAFSVGEYVDVANDEHPAICGGVTELMIKIELAKRYNIELNQIGFFDDVNKKDYLGLSIGDLAFAIYEYDIIFRSSLGYTHIILENKDKIIKKAE